VLSNGQARSRKKGIVHNPKEPMFKGEILTLKEELSIGGAASREPYSLAQVRSLGISATRAESRSTERKGREYFYDVFDEDGRYLIEVLLPYKSILFEGGKLYTCEADAEDFPVVKRYDVTWSLK
jgi:hypothetical protein